jgi:hypothetical protein
LSSSNTPLHPSTCSSAVDDATMVWMKYSLAGTMVLSLSIVHCASNAPEGTTNLGLDAAPPDASPNASPNAPPDAPQGGPNLPSTDPFSGAALDSSWSILHPEYASITTGAGKLTIEMKAKAIWAGPNEAVHVWKRVSGNFRATAQVSARGVASPDAAPRGPVRLGGLMARSTASLPRQNYVHVVVGFAPTGLSVETKTTLDNATTYDAPVWPTADAEVRICRLGQTMTLLKRSPSGGAWQTAATFDRGDLPAELAVGPNAYAQYGAGGPPSDAGPADASVNDAGPDLGPDLRVIFGPIAFEPVGSASDCTSER